MKKACLLYAAVIGFCMNAYTQKIQYSRQTFKMPYADAMQLVANISGTHHLLCFNTNKPPAIYIFDSQLQLEDKKEIDFKIKENCDIRLIPFKEYYFLYVHVLGTAQHELFKIDKDGNSNSLSKPFQEFVGRELAKSTSTLQLVNQNERLYTVSHTYYDVIKKMGSSVVELDKELNPVLIRKVLYNFNNGTEVFQQATLIGSSLFVLKTVKNDEKGNSLDIVKVDLATGQSLINSFNSGSHLYSNPAFSYNPNDSSVLVYSMVTNPISNTRIERTVFFSHLNYWLQETTPVTLLRSQFRNNTAANYLLLQGASCWVNMSNNLRIKKSQKSFSSQNFETEDDFSAINISRTYPSTLSYFAEYNQPTGVRLTVLNKQFKTIKDSLVSNDKKVYDVQPRPYSQFTIKNKSYLLLVQNFSSNRRGLLMVNMDDKGQLVTTDIRVFDKYEYLLQQLNPVNNDYVIFPYSHKNEIGLIKITIE